MKPLVCTIINFCLNPFAVSLNVIFCDCQFAVYGVLRPIRFAEIMPICMNVGHLEFYVCMYDLPSSIKKYLNFIFYCCQPYEIFGVL